MIYFGKVALSVDPNTCRVLWYYGYNKNCAIRILKYEGEGTPLYQMQPNIQNGVIQNEYYPYTTDIIP